MINWSIFFLFVMDLQELHIILDVGFQNNYYLFYLVGLGCFV